jgi:uncharacterized protein DUF3105
MASRKDEKERRRQERLAQQKALDEQARRRRLYSFVAGGGLVLAALVAIVVVVAAGGGGGGGGGDKLDVKAVDPPPQRQTDLVQAAKAADCKLLNPPIEGRTHTTEKVKYKTNPPSSGNHNPIPAADGAYGTAPPTEKLVHELEHGRIILQYDPKKVSTRRIGELKGLFEEDSYHLVLTPNATGMPYAVAAAAWGHIAGCKKFTDASSFDVLRAFRERYQDKGPEFVP